MKKILFSVLLISLTLNVFAKKIKFACDMTGVVLSPNGMHISGDFQTIAGYPGGDWNSGSTLLTQEGTTDIYSIVLDLPAFTKYEYKFVNGDQFYEAEFVPEPSRVLYNFVDNRWIYLDSLADDTTFVGAIQFAQNAPAGLTLVRFYVDMQNEIASSNGVHVAGNFQGWNPTSTILYSFGSNIYEIISYVTAGTYEYKFYNGNTSAIVEAIPALCAVNGNREVLVLSDTLLNMICYSTCSLCVSSAGIAENNSINYLQLTPNPVKDNTILKWNDNSISHSIALRDVTGRIIREYKNVNGTSLQIEKGNLDSGIYFVNISDDYSAATVKLIFE
ncbi:MAG: T9SS type A sorting domain-containing protein [Bacteroidia bacterium]